MSGASTLFECRYGPQWVSISYPRSGGERGRGGRREGGREREVCRLSAANCHLPLLCQAGGHYWSNCEWHVIDSFPNYPSFVELMFSNLIAKPLIEVVFTSTGLMCSPGN